MNSRWGTATSGGSGSRATTGWVEWEEASGFAAGAAVIAGVAFLLGTLVGLLLA
jgi:hypothetical protein